MKIFFVFCNVPPQFSSSSEVWGLVELQSAVPSHFHIRGIHLFSAVQKNLSMSAALSALQAVTEQVHTSNKYIIQ